MCLCWTGHDLGRACWWSSWAWCGYIYIYKVSIAHDIYYIYICSFLMFVCGPRTLSCPLGPTSPGLGLQSMHAALFAGWWPRASSWHYTCTSAERRKNLSSCGCLQQCAWSNSEDANAAHIPKHTPDNHQIVLMPWSCRPPCADTSFAEHLLSTLGRGVSCWQLGMVPRN